MTKSISLSLSDRNFNIISCAAKSRKLSVSNFIKKAVLRNLSEYTCIDWADTDLIKRLNSGHRDAKKMRGRLV